MAGPPAEKQEKSIPAERFQKFTSTTVHHLREPVRTIAIYSEMLRAEADSASPAAALRSAELIAGAAQKLQRLLDSLSELAGVSTPDIPSRSTVPLDLAFRHALLQVDADA